MNNQEVLNEMSKTNFMERKIITMLYRRSKKADIIEMVGKLADQNRLLCLKLLGEQNVETEDLELELPSFMKKGS